MPDFKIINPTIPHSGFICISSVASMFLGSLCLNTSIAQDVKPNVVLLMVDQQFADAMSCRIGNRYINTPAMNRLAANGMLFTRAYSPNPISMPARSSLFTGMYTHITGIKSNNVPRGGGWSGLTVMGTYFSNAGYETAFFGKWHLGYNIKNKAEHGFGICKEMSDYRRASGATKNLDTQCAESAVEFIRGKHDRPFLLVTSFLNPHNICEWARRLAGVENQVLTCGEIGDPPAVEMLPPPAANLGPQLNEPDGMTLLRRGYTTSSTFPVNDFTYDLWSKQRWGYYRMIEMVDGEIGKVIQALQSAGLEENTIIVFTADHGECAGAHGWNQKTVFFEESVRIPLIVTWKGKTPAGASEKLVNVGIDLLPTMLEFAGINKPAGLPGVSLKALSLGKKTGRWRKYVVAENDLQQSGEIDGFKPAMEGRMVRSDRFKYCIYSKGHQRESLVDMVNDPGETKNLAGVPAFRSILIEHRFLLKKFGIENNDPLCEKLLENNVQPIPFR